MMIELELLSLIKELCTRDHHADVLKNLSHLQWASTITEQKNGNNDFELMRRMLDYVALHAKTPPDLKSFRDYLAGC